MNKKEALHQLLKKYDVKFDASLNLQPGYYFLNKKLSKEDTPLLSWRQNRKFIELQKIVTDKTIEDVSMLRFCSFGDKEKWSLEALIYKELDLCEFLTGGKICSLHAAFNEGLAGNIIVKLNNGIIGSVEVSVQAYSGEKLLDRHEIIARRGVACDLVTDTQIPQASTYMYTEEGKSVYKDVDFELFGFDETQIEEIRSAFELFKKLEKAEQLKKQHDHLSTLVNYVFESNLKQQKIIIE